MFFNMDLVAFLVDDLGRFVLNGTVFLVGARILYWIVTVVWLMITISELATAGERLETRTRISWQRRDALQPRWS